MISRRNLLKSGVGFMAGLPYFLSGCAISNKTEITKPNILFIFSDQQTIKAQSASGNPHLSTPAMDAIAESGVRFEQSYCTSPVCGPARSSLITSRMPHETGVEWNDGSAIPQGMPTIGKIFKQAGYKTVWAGKWHLPESYPLRKGSGQKIIPDFEILPFFDATIGYPEWGYGDVTDEPLADAVVHFLENIENVRPFLLAVSFCNPHDICYVTRRPERYAGAEKFENMLPPLPPNYAVDADEPEFVKERRFEIDHYGEEILLSKDWTKQDWQVYLYHYYRMTERVDKQIGRVLAALRKRGLEKDTLIIFTSDHGDGAASHKWTAKLNLYEEATKVPFLISWPGHIPSGIVDSFNLISGLDVLPTLCDYAGIEVLTEFRGKSVRNFLENKTDSWRKYLVVELADDKLNKKRKGRMLRTARYKYNVYSQGKRNEQLFDLMNDPGETQNLAYEPSMQKIKDFHQSLLKEWIATTCDTFEMNLL